jgi:serine/threonine protein kinase/Tol biopolymer transport system component
MALTSGTRLGPYEILSPLGAGGMGEVYKARDPRLGRDVALKVLPASFSKDSDRLRRFEQEARAAGVLNHPNITAVFDIGTHEGSPYVVQELLEGESLRSVLASGRLPPRKAMDYASQIARGLAAAHEKGIVHRDLKPENLFVTRDERVKVLDFGLAKLTSPERPGVPRTEYPTETAGTEPGVVMGTPGYMSPEQVRGQAADHRSDIFSLGAILYEMLSGQRAFRGSSPADTMSAILREDPPDLSVTNSDLPPGLNQIERHCLEKNPERRFQSARDLAFDLEMLSATSGQAPVSSVPGLGTSKSRVRGAALGAALVLLLAAAYVAGRRTQRSDRVSLPSYHQLTYRHGTIASARFAPDGQTIAFAAAWEEAPLRLFSMRLEFPEAQPLGVPGSTLLAVSPQGELAEIVGGHPDHHLIVWGTLSQAALAGGAPREIVEDVNYADWAPDGKSLAVSHRVAGRARLEFPVGKVLYETSGWIGHPRISPAGDRIAFFDHPIWPDDRGSVAVVDLLGKKQTLSTGWESEEGLAWSPDGKEVWFTAATAGVARDLFAVSLAGRQRLVARVPGGMVLHDIFRDGRVLVTRDTERISALFFKSGENKEQDVGWLESAVPFDLSSDGKTLLFSEQGEAGGAHYTACLRRTDGSPVVRLGEGTPYEISPDGKWVISVVSTAPEQAILLPTGPGQARRLDRGAIENYLGASFFPDGKRILLSAKEPRGLTGLYVQELSGGKPRRMADRVVAFNSHAISPDGRTVVALDADQKIVLVPTEQGSPRPLPGFVAGDEPLRWSNNGSLFVAAQGKLPRDIFRVDIATGRRSLWKRLSPPDPAGVQALFPIVLTADGNSYAYGCFRVLSDLYLVEGLK